MHVVVVSCKNRDACLTECMQSENCLQNYCSKLEPHIFFILYIVEEIAIKTSH